MKQNVYKSELKVGLSQLGGMREGDNNKGKVTWKFYKGWRVVIMYLIVLGGCVCALRMLLIFMG